MQTKLNSILIAAILILSCHSAWSGSSVTGLMGFESSAVAFGGQFEHRPTSEDYGIGGFLLFSTEEEDAGKPQTISFGGFFAIHMSAGSKVDFSVSPGFAINLIELERVGEDLEETTFGPIIKLAVFYKLDPVDLGVEMFKAYNMLNDEVSGQIDYLNFALRFHL